MHLSFSGQYALIAYTDKHEDDAFMVANIMAHNGWELAFGIEGNTIMFCVDGKADFKRFKKEYNRILREVI